VLLCRNDSVEHRFVNNCNETTLISGSKVKRKLYKEKPFIQKKHTLKSCSPVEPLRPRRRFNIEKPASDFSELIPELQVIADLVKEIKGNTYLNLLTGYREVYVINLVGLVVLTVTAQHST
jgi:hypothetical protein